MKQTHCICRYVLSVSWIAANVDFEHLFKSLDFSQIKEDFLAPNFRNFKKLFEVYYVPADGYYYYVKYMENMPAAVASYFFPELCRISVRNLLQATLKFN